MKLKCILDGEYKILNIDNDDQVYFSSIKLFKWIKKMVYLNISDRSEFHYYANIWKRYFNWWKNKILTLKTTLTMLMIFLYVK